MRAILLSLVLLWATEAAAQTDAEVMGAYKQYRAAVESGDQAGALQLAEDAYNKAESAWGDKRTETALLATNYGIELSAAGREADAAKVFDRCAAILAKFSEAVSDRTFCFLKAGNSYRHSANPEAAIAAYEGAVNAGKSLAETDKVVSGYVGEAYLALAALSMPSGKDWRNPRGTAGGGTTSSRLAKRSLNGFIDTKRYAEKALPYLKRAYGDENETVAIAHSYIGFYYEAEGEWDKARDAYEIALSIFEKTRGENNTATLQMEGRYQFARMQWERETTPGPEARAGSTKKGGECFSVAQGALTIEVCPKVRKLPDYPTSTLYGGQQGFANILLDINADGTVENVRIANSWPGKEFDEAVLKAVRTWRYEPLVDQNGAPATVRDYKSFISFFIN